MLESHRDLSASGECRAVRVLREFGSSPPEREARRFARHRAGTREANVSTKQLRNLDLVMALLLIVFVVLLVTWLGLH